MCVRDGGGRGSGGSGSWGRWGWIFNKEQIQNQRPRLWACRSHAIPRIGHDTHPGLCVFRQEVEPSKKHF